MTKTVLFGGWGFTSSIFSKIVSGFIILSFLLSAPLSVFAQEVDIATPTTFEIPSNSVVENVPSEIIEPTIPFPEIVPAEENLLNDNSNSENLVDPNIESVSEESTVDESQKGDEEKIDEEPETESLVGDPDGPTNANGSFTAQSVSPKVDKTSGALIQNYPITIPKGRNGLQPNLALTYNSQNLEEGIVGYGWNINIPYIERINRRGTNNLYTDNYFNSSIDGEVSSTTSFNEYKPRVEEGDSFKYTFSTTTGNGGSWVAYDKNGTKYSFGTSTNARQEDSGDTTKVYRWMLEEVRDTNNNYIRFEYYKDAGQIYPYKIYYTGNNITDGIFQVEFGRESKTDVVKSYKTAFLVQTNYRINQIQAKVNGTWVRKYDLSYTTGANGYRSLLNSITESGQDEAGSGSISLPAVTFEYVNTPVTFSSVGGSTLGNINGAFIALADSDGNGLLDRNISYLDSVAGTNYNYLELNFNEGYSSIYNNSYYYNDVWARTGGTYGYLSVENGTRYFDINGDGFADAVRNQGIYESSPISRIYLNDGNYASTSVLSWTESFVGTSSLPSFSSTNISGKASTNGLFGNLNGDGLIDFEGSVTGYTWGHFGDGISFNASTTLFYPKALIPAYGIADLYGSQLIDINADGLDDWAYNNAGVIDFCLNTGLAWQSSCTNGFTIASTTIDSNGHDRGIRFTDINGDGLLDFVRSYSMPTYSTVAGPLSPPQVETSNIVLLNTGSGWATSTISIPTYIVQHVVSSGGLYTSSITPSLSEMWDWTGDGLSEFSAYKNNSSKPDILKKVNYSTGGNVQVSYQPTTQQMRNNKAKHVNLPMQVHVVTALVNNDANGNYSTTTYSYENGDMYYNTGYDRKFAGFENIIETSDEAITKTYFHQGNIASTTVGELSDDFSLIGKSYREDITSTTTGNIFKKTFYKWDSNSKSNNRYFVSLGRVVEENFDGDSSHKDKASTFLYNTDTGKVIQKINYGEVSGSTDGTFSDIGSDLASTTITYSASTTVNMFLPAVETTQNQSLTKIRENKYYYDSLSSGSANIGNLTKQEMWKDNSNYASTTKTYNSYGLVTQSKDPRSNATDHTYDTYNLYVATSTNPLSQTTAYSYDYSSGKVKQTVDSNSRVFQNTYDGFDRLTEVKQPDISTPTNLVTKSVLAYTDNTVPTKVQETNYLNSATSTDKYTYFDGFGRKIQERLEAEGDSTYSVKDYVYGNIGRITKDSLPYFASSSVNSSATSTNTLYNFYSYDSLGRVTKVTNAVGSTTNTYDDWHVTVTDSLGKPKDFYKDAYGNLVNVVEHNSGIHATTTYGYDLNQNLTSITDALGNLRNFTYDGMNRRLTAQDLHASGDGTFGSYTYTYDDASNLTQKVDPKSQTVNYTYDSLNRPATEDYTGLAGTEVTYTYDSGTDGKGRLTTASSTDAKITNSYNALGGIKISTTTIAGISYTTQYDYDRQGNQTSITYPDNSQVAHLYNSAGLLETTRKKESGESTYSNVVNSTDYSPTGSVLVIANANNSTTTNTYDQNSLYRLTNKTTTISGGSKAQDLSYTYDANGNITQIVDSSNTATAKTINYTYDDLTRLTIASTTNATTSPNYRYTYFYDVLGNINTQYNGTATTTYNYAGNTGSLYANPHAATTIVTTTGTGGGVSTSTPTYIQSKKDSSGTGSVTFNSSVTTGNLVVVAVTIWNTTIPTNAITDNKGNTYTRALEVVNSGTTDHGAIFYAKNVTGGSSFAVTSSVGGTIAVHEYSGVSIYSPLDKVASTTGSSTLPSSGNVTTTLANELYFGMAWSEGDGAAWNAGYGYTLRENETNNSTAERIATEDKVITSASTTPAFFTTGNNAWLAAIATFKPATTTGSGSTSTTTLTYDNNGNLLTDGTLSYTWDYRNRLTQSGTGTATSTYAYDHDVNRVKLTEGSVTSIYPNKLYSKIGTATSTKSIFANNTLVATVDSVGGGSTSTTTAYTIFGDSTTWSDWSWGSTRDFNETSVVYAGTKSLEVTYTSAWGGLHLRHATGVNTATSTHLEFAVRSSSANPTVEIDAYGPSDTLLGDVLLSSYLPGGTMSANTWYQVAIPLADLSAANTYFTGFVAMRSTTGTLYFDDIKLITVATGSTATSTINYIHADHLGSTNVVTNASSTITQTLDYYPYGQTRVKTGSDTSKREYIGEHLDELSQLSYLNARFYNSARGNFVSQDPVFWEVGVTDSGQKVLLNPQLQNSYSYAGGNPIVNRDSDGREPITLTMGTVAGSLLIWSWASFLYSGLQDQIRNYEIETMRSYPDVYSQESIQEAEKTDKNQDNLDSAGVIIGAVNSKAGVAYDAVNLAKDVYDQNPNRISRIFDYLGGSFQYETTPKFYNADYMFIDKPSNYNLKSSNGTSNNNYSNRISSSLSSVSTSLSAASAAISRGDYVAAGNYLNSASKSLNGTK